MTNLTDPARDAAVDQAFCSKFYDLVGPFRGECGICGAPDARHRLFEAVRDAQQDQSAFEVAHEYDQTTEQVEAVWLAAETGRTPRGA